MYSRIAFGISFVGLKNLVLSVHIIPLKWTGTIQVPLLYLTIILVFYTWSEIIIDSFRIFSSLLYVHIVRYYLNIQPCSWLKFHSSAWSKLLWLLSYSTSSELCKQKKPLFQGLVLLFWYEHFSNRKVSRNRSICSRVKLKMLLNFLKQNVYGKQITILACC